MRAERARRVLATLSDYKNIPPRDRRGRRPRGAGLVLPFLMLGLALRYEAIVIPCPSPVGRAP